MGRGSLCEGGKKCDPTLNTEPSTHELPFYNSYRVEGFGLKGLRVILGLALESGGQGSTRPRFRASRYRV